MNEQVPRRKAGDLGKGLLQVGSQSIDDLRSPALPMLTFEDLVSNLPVEQHELTVDGQDCSDLGRMDSRLQGFEKEGIVQGQL